MSESVEEMNEAHAELGRKAAELALQVLENLDVSEIPVASAVSLLKFGIELERKALLGTESDGDGAVDPFEALAKAMGQAAPEQDSGEG